MHANILQQQARFFPLAMYQNCKIIVFVVCNDIICYISGDSLALALNFRLSVLIEEIATNFFSTAKNLITY